MGYAEDDRDSVTLTFRHVALLLRVYIVQTGISLMELDWDSPVMVVIYIRFVELRELTSFVGIIFSHHLVYIAVKFQLMTVMVVS